jgi:putative heme-binding domain-containing protein
VNSTGIFALCLASFLGLISTPASGASEVDLKQGRDLYAISCTNSFCHGPAGAAGQAPALKNRDLTPDFIMNTVLRGRPGTPMPAFENDFTPEEIAAIVAYVASLSPRSAASAAAIQPANIVETAEPKLTAQAARGRELFFDMAQPGYCAACHSFRNLGGPVGPDLAAIGKTAPQQIYESMAHPAAGNPAYPTVRAKTRDGEAFIGIERDDRDDAIRVYDLSSLPPVLRSIPKSDVTAEAAIAYDHHLSSLPDQTIADLIAFLKSADSAPPITLTPDNWRRQ